MADQTIDLATRIYGLLDSRATYNGDQFIAETARLIHEDRAAVAADRDKRIASLEAQLASAREAANFSGCSPAFALEAVRRSLAAQKEPHGR